MDGIKTGYIRASGFNLAASAVRNNRRLIGVVMGGQSAYARDSEMAHAAERRLRRRRRAELSRRQWRPPRTIRTPPSPTARAARSPSLSPVGRAEAAVPVRTRTARGRHGGWSIQVGAFGDEDAAEQAATKALRPSARAARQDGASRRARPCRQGAGVPRPHREFLRARSQQGLPHAASQAPAMRGGRAQQRPAGGAQLDRYWSPRKRAAANTAARFDSSCRRRGSA